MYRSIFLLALMLSGHAGNALAAGPGYLGDLNGQTFSIGNTRNVGALFPAGSTFSDVYFFDLGANSALAASTVTIDLDLPQVPGPEFGLSDMMLQLMTADDQLVAMDRLQHPGDTVLTLGTTLLKADGYKFIVSGKVVGNFGGSYGGVLQTYSLPIPEADAYVLIALGGVLLGLRLHGRKSSLAAA
ncbi:MAG: hypothetical protein HXY26_09425 [Hydrogenophilaceae bacterium]|nr:hypothetical protein [Hydrogenophilaceae bacterium]